MSVPSDERFVGISRLYGAVGFEQLAKAHVCVVGVGGVGSWTVEALGRSGVGRLTLVDLDDVCVSNSNRQVQALSSTLGRPKVDVLAERLRDINPDVTVQCVREFATPQTIASLLAEPYDWVVDAIDQFKNKCVLLTQCRTLGRPLIVVGGAGGRLDPTRVRTGDITESHGDRLLAMMRKRLRQKFELPRHGPWGIPCVYSDEPPRFPGDCVSPGQNSLRLDCATGFGAASFVTAVFGMQAAALVVNQLAAA